MSLTSQLFSIGDMEVDQVSFADQMLKLFGEVVAVGGGAAAVAYVLFQFLGRKWIENKFAERLEFYKHQQALELQKLRIEIESMLSGALKLQELEFDVLPKAWDRLDQAYGLACASAAAFRSYAVVEEANTQQLTEILQKTLPDLRDSERSDLLRLTGEQRTERYQKLVDWNRYHRARKAHIELASYIASKGLFLPETLREKFNDAVDKISIALISIESSLQFDTPKTRGGANTDLQTIHPLIKAIEKAIGERLHSHAQGSL